MTERSKDPDQHSSNFKMKFFTTQFIPPAFKKPWEYNPGLLHYGPDGTMRKTSDDNILKLRGIQDYSKMNKSKFVYDETPSTRFDDKFFKEPEEHSNESIFISREKSRFINATRNTVKKYEKPDSNVIADIKIGKTTKTSKRKAPSKEVDRFYKTFTNYQHAHFGSNPYPEDTRGSNKKTLN